MINFIIMPVRKKSQGGFAALLPVLIIVVVAVAAVVLSSSFKNAESSKVLGDSSEGDGTQLQVSTQGQENQTPESKDTPEPKDTPEAKDTPEPKDTPEANQQEVETQVKDGTGEAKIRIRKGNALQFQQNGVNVQVQGNTPLSVNPTTKELTVTTPQGSKTVTVLPDQALQNLIGNGVISTQSGIVLSTDANGNPVYQVNGVKYEKLFGIFNITIDKTGQVSAVNGQILGVVQSPLSKLLDVLSF